MQKSRTEKTVSPTWLSSTLELSCTTPRPNQQQVQTFQRSVKFVSGSLGGKATLARSPFISGWSPLKHASRKKRQREDPGCNMAGSRGVASFNKQKIPSCKRPLPARSTILPIAIEIVGAAPRSGRHVPFGRREPWIRQCVHLLHGGAGMADDVKKGPSGPWSRRSRRVI
jgi:hypothetical protein